MTAVETVIDIPGHIVGTLELPYPKLLPDCHNCLSRPARELLHGESVLACITRPAIAQLTGADEPPENGTRRASHAEENFREHDRFFHVLRTADEPAAAFLHGLVLAHSRAYQNALEMGSTLLTEADWRNLLAGLECVFVFAGQASRDDRLAIALPAWHRAGDERHDPQRRWLVGHQLYFALIQGVIVGLKCFATARKAGHQQEAADSLRLATTLMYSSATAVKYTSDFGLVDYERKVRPTMSQPAVRKGFSGLQTRDHASLIQLFRQLRPLFAELNDLAGLREEFIESVVEVYAAHEFICARFGGYIMPSLRMAATTQGKTERAGVDVIRQMMRARLSLITGAQPAAALVAR